MKNKIYKVRIENADGSVTIEMTKCKDEYKKLLLKLKK